MRSITPDEWTSAPWRNGGGITHEVYREGPTESFHWRVSVADVEQDGPFSHFPDVDRVIALLDGSGFTLTGTERPPLTLTEAGAPYAFRGEEAIACSLVAGPVRDLNFMVDRRRFRLDCEVMDLAAESRVVAADGARLGVFIVTGEVAIGDRRAGRWTFATDDQDIVVVGAPRARIVVARIAPRTLG